MSPPARIVIMGVAGCGKSTVGSALARAMNVRYVDGDDLHPAENIARMTRGEPLTDDDRWPWLTHVGACLTSSPEPIIVGCSALKRRYRDRIRELAGKNVMFVHLTGSRKTIERRAASRTGHFMPASLLGSQFDALEPPAPDELAIGIDIEAPLDDIVSRIRAQLG